MADTAMLFSIALVIITCFLYGLKWAILISITIYFCAVVLLPLNSRGSGKVERKRDLNESNREYCDQSEIDSFNYTEMESSGTRLVRNIVRRNPTLTQDLPFNTLQMYKSRQASRSSLRSPEPLLSQVTKHLSFK